MRSISSIVRKENKRFRSCKRKNETGFDSKTNNELVKRSCQWQCRRGLWIGPRRLQCISLCLRPWSKYVRLCHDIASQSLVVLGLCQLHRKHIRRGQQRCVVWSARSALRVRLQKGKCSYENIKNGKKKFSQKRKLNFCERNMNKRGTRGKRVIYNINLNLIEMKKIERKIIVKKLSKRTKIKWCKPLFWPPRASASTLRVQSYPFSVVVTRGP